MGSNPVFMIEVKNMIAYLGQMLAVVADFVDLAVWLLGLGTLGKWVWDFMRKK
jgi:hypothetical protein